MVGFIHLLSLYFKDYYWDTIVESIKLEVKWPQY